MSRLLSLLIIFAVIFVVYLFVQHSREPVLPSSTKLEDKAPAVSHETWHEFTAPGGKFKVLLPSLPQHVTETANDPKNKEVRSYDTYVSTSDNGTAFWINLISFPTEKDMRNTEELLTGVLNDILTHKDSNKLKTMDLGMFHGSKSLRFSIGSDEMNIEGLVFMKGRTLCLLTMISKGDVYNPKDFEFFTNSFDLQNIE